MKAVKILGGSVLGLVGLVVVLYLVAVAINWKDRPPSAEVLHFRQLLDERRAVADHDNAFVYLLGFAVPAGKDPLEVGARRRAWLEAFSGSTDTEGPDADEDLDLESQPSAAIEQLKDLCPGDEPGTCEAAFTASAEDWQPSQMEQLTLDRYRALLKLRQWREVVPMHFAAPWLHFSGPFHAQRLHMLSLMKQAARGETETVREGLAADHDYWRAAQTGAQSLLTRMLSGVGLRHHYYYSNLVLRGLPPQEQARAIPEGWQREFSAEERSMWPVFAGEVAFTRRLLADSAYEREKLEGLTGWERALNLLTVPLFKVQDTVNGTAATYARICRKFDVSMSGYDAAKTSLRDEGRSHESWSIYNPMGKAVNAIADDKIYIGYVYRAANAEGMRRAALLMARLRSQRLPPDALAASVAATELRDPYTDRPFEWNVERQSVIFDVPEDKARPRAEFAY
jgi:hypothetical protein